MDLLKNARVVAGAFLIAGVAVAGQRAFADSYTTYTISAGNQGNVDNIGLTDSGTLTTLTFTGTNLTYTTFTPPSTSVTSPTLPAFTFDNGSACSPSVSGLSGISMAKCNNGREVFEAFDGKDVLPNLYLINNGQPPELLYAGPADDILLNAMGDIAFVGINAGNGDTNFYDYDATSHAAVTPEPSSLVLLLTGGLGTAAAWRRKLRYRS